jgi:hypothetical protein
MLGPDACPVVGLPMTTNQPTHRRYSDKATSSSRQRTCRQRPVVLQPSRYVELDHVHEEAALAALADLLVPYLDQPETNQEESA